MTRNMPAAMKPIDPKELVRGQYVGYRDEPGVAADDVPRQFVPDQRLDQPEPLQAPAELAVRRVGRPQHLPRVVAGRQAQVVLQRQFAGRQFGRFVVDRHQAGPDFAALDISSYDLSFDAKAIALQRTGKLGTYASCLGM